MLWLARPLRLLELMKNQFKTFRKSNPVTALNPIIGYAKAVNS